tara:strand:- start:1193 stop:2308 length:1116 start_codon:yes stop_codon:yes gene_type:complete
MAKIIVGVNTAWNLINFRQGLLKVLISKGHEVIAVAPSDRYVPNVQELGCRYLDLKMNSGSKNPINDLLLFIRFIKIFLREKPDIFLGFTIKPNIYGSFAARLFGAKVINNIAGLGTAFSERNWVTRVAEFLYRISLSGSSQIFFQNQEDRDLFVDRKIVTSGVVDILPGSGVDLEKFKPVSMPQGTKIIFLMVSRLLWEKGVGQFVEAAEMVRVNCPEAEFRILGFLDVDNPSAISREQMNKWVNEGSVQYLGQSDDVQAHIGAAHCVVLPSFYGEGTPRVLLEAAASARPIITTDSVGCRNTVDERENGYLAIPRDEIDLADKMMKFIALSDSEKSRMGENSRKKAEQEFDERFVVEKYLDVIEAVRQA